MNGLKRSFKLRRRCAWAREQWWGLAGVLLALSGGFACAGEGEVYTWKDAAGRVHYGNHAPEGQAAERVPLNAQPVTVQPTRHIYTWTDVQGKIHYGAQPPPDVPAKELSEEDSSLSTIRSGQVREGERQLLRELPQGD